VGPDESASAELSPLAASLDGLFRDQTQRILRDLQISPNSPVLLNAVGLSYFNEGLVDEAVSYFEKALDNDATNLHARLNLARCELARGKPRDAVERCRAIGKEFPENEAVFATLAEAHSRLGEHEEAASVFTALLEKRPEDIVALYNRGVQNLLVGRFDRAIADFRSVVRANVRFAPAHNSLGVCYLASGAPKKAVRHLEVAAQLDRAPEVARNLAVGLVQAGKPANAVALLERHLRTFPRDWDAQEALAGAYRKLGQPQPCMRTLSELLKARLETDADRKVLARLRNNLGVAYAELAQLDKAEEQFQASLILSERVPVPFHNLARLYLSQGRVQKARRLFEQHAQKFPDDAVTLCVGGRVFERVGKYDDAEELYRRAIQVDPQSPDVHACLGRLLCEYRGDYAQAVDVLSRAVEQSPRRAVFLNNLAYTLLMSNRTGEAREILERIRGADDDVYVTATRGLLQIREGNVREGEALYKKAAKLARTRELRVLVEQKREVELARYWLEKAESNRSEALLRSALARRTIDDVYTRQAAALFAQIRPAER